MDENYLQKYFHYVKIVSERILKIQVKNLYLEDKDTILKTVSCILLNLLYKCMLL